MACVRRNFLKMVIRPYIQISDIDPRLKLFGLTYGVGLCGSIPCVRPRHKTASQKIFARKPIQALNKPAKCYLYTLPSTSFGTLFSPFNPKTLLVHSVVFNSISCLSDFSIFSSSETLLIAALDLFGEISFPPIEDQAKRPSP